MCGNRRDKSLWRASFINSMAKACSEAGVPVITGDTKVVEKGKGDGVFITTTGIGMVPDGYASYEILRRLR